MLIRDKSALTKVEFFKPYVDVYMYESPIDHKITYSLYNDDLLVATIYGGSITMNNELMSSQKSSKWKAWVLKDVASIYEDIQSLSRYWESEVSDELRLSNQETAYLHGLSSMVHVYGYSPRTLDGLINSLKELAERHNFDDAAFIKLSQLMVIPFTIWMSCREEIFKMAKSIHSVSSDDTTLFLATIGSILNNDEIAPTLQLAGLEHLTEMHHKLSESLYDVDSRNKVSLHTTRVSSGLRERYKDYLENNEGDGLPTTTKMAISYLESLEKGK